MVVTVPLHPTLAKVHREVVMPFFEQAGLALLEDEAAAARVLDMLRGDHAQVADALADEFARKPGATGAARWQAICKVRGRRAGRWRRGRRATRLAGWLAGWEAASA
jgi:hypothetical protein